MVYEARYKEQKNNSDFCFSLVIVILAILTETARFLRCQRGHKPTPSVTGNICSRIQNESAFGAVPQTAYGTRICNVTSF